MSRPTPAQRECNRRRVERLKAAGLCRSCGKVPFDPERSRYECARCLDVKVANFQKKWESLEFRKEWYEYQRRKDRQYRLDAIAAYGGQCTCCEEKNPIFLDFDHIHNDGAEDRRKLHGGSTFIKWLRKHKYPRERIQLLCANCNQGKHRNGGVCPHKEMSNG